LVQCGDQLGETLVASEVDAAVWLSFARYMASRLIHHSVAAGSRIFFRKLRGQLVVPSKTIFSYVKINPGSITDPMGLSPTFGPWAFPTRTSRRSDLALRS
jgi:hypothetical protein